MTPKKDPGGKVGNLLPKNALGKPIEPAIVQNALKIMPQKEKSCEARNHSLVNNVITSAGKAFKKHIKEDIVMNLPGFAVLEKGGQPKSGQRH